MDLVSLSMMNLENVGRPALGKDKLRIAQDAQDQPAYGVLALAGSAQITVHQGPIESLGGGADGRSQ